MRVSSTSRMSAQDPRNATVRIGPLIELPALVRHLGYDPDPIFAVAGFKPVQFSEADPDDEIPYIQGSKLLSHCVTVTGCEHLGLLLGQRAGPSSLGVVGFILQSSPDVGTALRSLVRHLDLHDEGAVATLLTHNQHTFMGYAIHLSGVKGADQIYDMSMTIICNIMRSLCGPNWEPDGGTPVATATAGPDTLSQVFPSTNSLQRRPERRSISKPLAGPPDTKRRPCAASPS